MRRMGLKTQLLTNASGTCSTSRDQVASEQQGNSYTSKVTEEIFLENCIVFILFKKSCQTYHKSGRKNAPCISPDIEAGGMKAAYLKSLFILVSCPAEPCFSISSFILVCIQIKPSFKTKSLPVVFEEAN